MPLHSNTLRRLWQTLAPGQRRQVVLLAVAVVLMALLEVVNVMAIMPFLSAAADPATVRQHRVLGNVAEWLGIRDDRLFLVLLGTAVFTLLLVSNAWTAMTTWLEVRLVWSWNHAWSSRILRRYVYRPYTFFLNRNTSDLLKNVLSEVEQLAAHLLVPGVEAVGRAVVVVALVLAMVLVEPGAALLATVVVGGSYAIVFRATRRKLGQVGSERVAANQARFRAASDVLAGIKDVKLLGLEEDFLRRFERASSAFSRQRSTAEVIGRVPRYLIEPVAMGTVILLVVYLLARGGDLARIVPLLGFYAFAGYRLMPGVQQIFRGVTQYRFYAPALRQLLAEAEMDTGPDKPMVTATGGDRLVEPLLPRERIELRGVWYQYPSSARPVLRDVSLTIRAGSVVGIVGATGSGKTTLADLILGLLQPTAGQILVDGIPLDETSLPRWQAALGYVPQQIFLLDASVAENIAFGVAKDRINMEAVRRAARLAQIDRFIEEELPLGYDTAVGERGIRLSGGQRQRIGIARALYRNPTILVLDEATSALDTATEEGIMEAVQQLSGQRTIIMIAHRLTTLRLCETVFMLKKGCLVATGSYEDLMRGTGLFAELLRT